MAESHNSEVTTLWRYTNLFIIIIIINMKKALLLSSTSPFSQCNSAFCVRGNCACAESRDAWVGGQKQLHFLNPRSRFAYSLCNFYCATTTINGRLLSSRPMLKPFSGEKISVEMRPKNGGLGGNLRFWFRDPQKALLCAEPRRLTYFAWKSVHASRL